MSDNTVFDFDDTVQDIGNISNTDVYCDAELYPNEDLETLDLDYPAFHDDNVNPEEWGEAESDEHDSDGEVAKLEAMLAFWEAMATFDGLITQLDGSRAELDKEVAACDGHSPKLEKNLIELKGKALKTCDVALRLNTDLFTLTIKIGSEDEHVIEIDDHLDTLNERLSMFNDRVVSLIKKYNTL